MEGTCTGVVVNTGDRTVMGRIAKLTSSIREIGGQSKGCVRGAEQGAVRGIHAIGAWLGDDGSAK